MTLFWWGRMYQLYTISYEVSDLPATWERSGAVMVQAVVLCSNKIYDKWFLRLQGFHVNGKKHLHHINKIATRKCEKGTKHSLPVSRPPSPLWSTTRWDRTLTMQGCPRMTMGTAADIPLQCTCHLLQKGFWTTYVSFPHALCQTSLGCIFSSDLLY